MKAIIVLFFLVTFLVIYVQSSAMAQDISIQSSSMGNLSLLRITDIKADLLAPITVKIAMNDEDFSEIAWRGLTMHYLKTEPQVIKEAGVICVDRKLLNSFCQRPVNDENQMVRHAWSEALGFDVWYPYYQAKKVEGWVFKMKGELILEKGRFMYAFKTKF
jgi:hypothetical protein